MTQEEDNIYRALISNTVERKELQLISNILAKLLSNKGGVLNYNIKASHLDFTVYDIQVSTYETNR